MHFLLLFKKFSLLDPNPKITLINADPDPQC